MHSYIPIVVIGAVALLAWIAWLIFCYRITIEHPGKAGKIAKAAGKGFRLSWHRRRRSRKPATPTLEPPIKRIERR